MPTSVAGLAVDVTHERAAGESDCLLPVFHQKGHCHDLVFWVSVGEEGSSCSLQGSGRHQVHHIPLGAEDASTVQFHADSSATSLLKLLLKEDHRLAAQRAGRLLLRVSKDVGPLFLPAATGGGETSKGQSSDGEQEMVGKSHQRSPFDFAGLAGTFAGRERFRQTSRYPVVERIGRT